MSELASGSVKGCSVTLQILIYLSNINKHNASKCIETLRGITSIWVPVLQHRGVFYILIRKRHTHTRQVCRRLSLIQIHHRCSGHTILHWQKPAAFAKVLYDLLDLTGTKQHGHFAHILRKVLRYMVKEYFFNAVGA